MDQSSLVRIRVNVGSPRSLSETFECFVHTSDLPSVDMKVSQTPDGSDLEPAIKSVLDALCRYEFFQKLLEGPDAKGISPSKIAMATLSVEGTVNGKQDVVLILVLVNTYDRFLWLYWLIDVFRIVHDLPRSTSVLFTLSHDTFRLYASNVYQQVEIPGGFGEAAKNATYLILFEQMRLRLTEKAKKAFLESSERANLLSSVIPD